MEVFSTLDDIIELIPTAAVTAAGIFLIPGDYKIPITAAAAFYVYTYTIHPSWCNIIPDVFNSLKPICMPAQPGDIIYKETLSDQIGLSNIPIIGQMNLFNYVPAIGGEQTTQGGDLQYLPLIGEAFKPGTVLPQDTVPDDRTIKSNTIIRSNKDWASLLSGHHWIGTGDPALDNPDGHYRDVHIHTSGGKVTGVDYAASN